VSFGFAFDGWQNEEGRNQQHISTVTSLFSFDGWLDEIRRHQERSLLVSLGFNLHGSQGQEAVQSVIQR
jgi:hypothetical protein